MLKCEVNFFFVALKIAVAVLCWLLEQQGRTDFWYVTLSTANRANWKVAGDQFQIMWYRISA